MKWGRVLLIMVSLMILGWGTRLTLFSDHLKTVDVAPAQATRKLTDAGNADVSGSSMKPLLQYRRIAANEQAIATALRSEASAIEENGPNHELMTIRREISHLKSDLASMHHLLEEQSNLLMSTLLLVTHPESQSSYKLRQIQELVDAEAEQKTSEQSERLENALTTEHLDEKWSGRAIVAIERAFEVPLMDNATLQDVDCRTTLCRVEASFDQSIAPKDFKAIIAAQVTELFGVAVLGTTDVYNDTATAVIYLARDGYDSPVAEDFPIFTKY